ncbi:MAG: hypothetical protein RL100_597 [Actinomycetota bacterium]
MTDPKAAAAARLGLHNQDGKLNLTKTSLLASVGGPLGIAEAIIPSTVFVIMIAITKNTVASVLTAAGLSAIFLIRQIIAKKPLTQAIAGAVGIAISAFLPLREGGQAADYFIQGFITNAVYFAVLSASVLVRWPIIGVLAGLLLGEGTAWRKDKAQLRRFTVATLVWIALFAGRLIVQVPLYFAQQTELLGIFRIAMGTPLYALCIWFTWLLIRGIITTRR